MKKIYGATDEARKKIANGYNPFGNNKKDCGCGGNKCAVNEKSIPHVNEVKKTTDEEE